MFYHTITAGLVLCAGALATQGAEWLHDLEAAQAQAKAENKALLIFFTGSDWCGWCVRLHSTIFNTPSFSQYAQDKFVLLEIDMPHNKAKQSPAQQAQNKALVSKYHITSYPTVLVLTTEEEVIGGFIGGRDTQAQVLTPLNDALRRQQQLQAAEKLPDPQKTQTLLEIYRKVPTELKPYFQPLRDKIARLDTPDATGIRAEIADASQMEQLEQLVAKGGTPYKPVLRTLQQAYAQASPANKPKIRELQLQFLEQTQHRIVMTADNTDDVQELKNVLQEIILLSSPADAKALQHEIDNMFRDPEKVLETLKAKQQNK
ncbi:MAG: DUF255 domain-containing protein [Akkermansiaceae bacterium]|nr:DUF255 domain-containing protein [Akkermansiaceae bacterium]